MDLCSENQKRILITGGSGFIGTNLVDYLINNSQYHIVNFDKLTYASNSHHIDKYSRSRYSFVWGDICDFDFVYKTLIDYDIDGVIHLAAESHVDRSITGPSEFIETNIRGTYNLLEAVRKIQPIKNIRFHHVSTDEVYGDLSEEDFPFVETTPYNPSSPYSASKASSDHLVRSWHRTYGLDCVISNCSNNYGPYQNQEKFIPKIIVNALNNEPIPVYGTGKNIRDWLYVKDHCSALKIVFEKGISGESYNIGSSNERSNNEIVSLICSILDRRFSLSDQKSKHNLVTYTEDRAGHDFRYAIDYSKIQRELNWYPEMKFEDGILETINFYSNRMASLNSGNF